MNIQDAQRTLAQFLAPLRLDEFLDRTLCGGFRKIDGRDAPARTALLGADPENTLLAAWHLAPKLTFHSANPAGEPPSLQGIASATDFRRRIVEFHARNYSVRFPELRPISPALDSLARAFEVLLHQPVTASAFWSQAGMRAPVHFDDHDLVVVQLRGSKRWYVSSKPSELNNTWKHVPARTLELGSHVSVDVGPGDMLYLPRGTLHSVDSLSGSLHVAIGFTPLTLREALIAAVDHLSDLDPRLRQTVGSRVAFQVQSGDFARLARPLADAAAGVLEACRMPDFITSAMQWRSSRAIGGLRPLQAPSAVPSLRLDSELFQRPDAFCHLSAGPATIDVSYPGGHLYIHRGAEESVVYIVNTPRFRVMDIPGAASDAVRLSLATRFLEIGFLQHATAEASRT